MSIKSAVGAADYSEKRNQEVFWSTDYADLKDFIEVVVGVVMNWWGLRSVGLMKLDLWEGVGRAKALYFRIVTNPRHKCRA
ncbi:MAG: hypothetical protein M0Q90_06840 [Bacteroidales bacterium]|nr:hypothetical protein [Bacteroidales bacterium]